MQSTEVKLNGILFHGIALIVLLASVTGFSQEKPNSCLDCHSALEGNLKVSSEMWSTDIHRIKGLGCVDCHGGDATTFDDQLAMNRARGFGGAPKGMAIVQMCGKCHSDAALMKRFNPAQRVDQVSEYFTSVHGQRLKQGDQHVATCVSCHGVHEIRPVGDPRARVFPLNIAETCGACHSNAALMAPYGIKTTQKDEYMKSVHYRALTQKQDLSAPTCNKCHGNHGATPPGVGSVSNVCGQCHAVFAELFDKSPHKSAFAKRNLPSCVYCHGNHEIKPPDDAMLGISEDAVCTRCHKASDAGFVQAKAMREGIDRLKASLAKSESLLAAAEFKGMEVSQPKFELIEGRQNLTKSRVQIHSSNSANVQEFLDAGMKISAHAEEKGRQALDEYQLRRKGLAVSLVIILAVIVGLYFKIRDIERRQSEERR